MVNQSAVEVIEGAGVGAFHTGGASEGAAGAAAAGKVGGGGAAMSAVDKNALLRNALKRTFSGSFMDGSAATGAHGERTCRGCQKEAAAPQSAMCDRCNRSWVKGAGGALRPGTGAGSMEPAGMMPSPAPPAAGMVHAQIHTHAGPAVKGEVLPRGQVTAFDKAAANVAPVAPEHQGGGDVAFGFELNEFFDELFEAGGSDGDGESADVEPIDFAVDLERFVVGEWAAGTTQPGAAAYDVEEPDIIEERPEAFRNSAAKIDGSFWTKARPSSGSEVSTASTHVAGGGAAGPMAGVGAGAGGVGVGVGVGGGGAGAIAGGLGVGVVSQGGAGSMEADGHTPRKKYVYGKEGVAGGQPGGQCLRCHGCVRPNKHPGHCKARSKDAAGAKREASEQALAAAKKKPSPPLGMADRLGMSAGAVVVGP